MGISVHAEGLRRTYAMAHGKVEVLRGADLRIDPGETVAIVGASGSGKSTLLHILGALDRPEAGRVVVGNEDVYAMDEGRRGRLRAATIGFVFQSYHLLSEMTVVENVMLPALAVSPLGLPSAAARRRACELLESVGLGHRLEHRPQELSGGEQQRTALARSMMNTPSLILADEPTGNLDDETGRHVLDALFGMAERDGVTLVIVTHSGAVAARCRRQLRLASGVLVDMAQ
jgi:predicted ABC-type transport system involved in lysophospholipase L1 biosynthesis ATPase subunit